MERRDEFVDALVLYGRAPDLAAILRVLERQGVALFERGEGPALTEALAAVPETARGENASTLGLRAMLEASRGRFDLAEISFKGAIERAAEPALKNALVHRFAIELVRHERDCIELLEPPARDASVPAAERIPMMGTLATAYVRAGRIDDAKLTIGRAIDMLEPTADSEATERTARCRVTTTRRAWAASTSRRWHRCSLRPQLWDRQRQRSSSDSSLSSSSGDRRGVAPKSAAPLAVGTESFEAPLKVGSEMKVLRAVVVAAVVVVAAYLAYRFFLEHRSEAADTITVYYCKIDGATLAPWKVSLGPDRSRKSVAAYALAQVVVGPPSSVEAIRFPAGTVVRGVTFDGSTAVADLSGTIAGSVGGSFAEAGEFKALVWTLTDLPGIADVQIEIDGRKVSTLPGGHLELDQPLARSNF